MGESSTASVQLERKHGTIRIRHGKGRAGRTTTRPHTCRGLQSVGAEDRLGVGKDKLHQEKETYRSTKHPNRGIKIRGHELLKCLLGTRKLYVHNEI